jgi:hypothetical protein
MNLGCIKIRFVSFNVVLCYDTIPMPTLNNLYTFNIRSECVITVNIEALVLIVYSFSEPYGLLTFANLRIIT